MKKYLPLVARLLFGLIFFVFGLNGFFHFMPTPPMTGAPAEYFAGLNASRFSLPLISGVQTLCGLAFLSGMFVPLALVVLAPVIANIVLFHVFVAPEGLGIALVVAALETYLAFFSPYRERIVALFRAR